MRLASTKALLNAGAITVNIDTTAPVDWTRFAYIQYVTNTAYLCNSVMLFETLHRLHSKPERLMMYPSIFSVNDTDSTEGRLLRKARDEYNVKLAPVEVQSRPGGDPTWSESYTKLLAFNQTQYNRVLSLDSDSTVLQPMDELFHLPPCPLALPRAYWLDLSSRTLSSQLMLIQPSENEFTRVMAAVSTATSSEYDMNIITEIYRDSALILPHRPYNLLTGEFRSKEHTAYLGSETERWDAERVLAEARFLHFSDWPVPKPWIAASPAILRDHQPTCDKDPETQGGEEGDCRERDLWLGFYEDFARRRKEVCDIDVGR
ncbi:nucleotide-diphospho-sugar transferase [Aspergillus karnatakaensis]|uniref:nucleotide-diphospho-sugar transferase n=1 Tax=Aspergillus karnatakaensis TaxID=1810916 RepID=UPI003CCE112C